MEVIPSRSGGSGSMPFQRHNVKEWSRVDSVTGMLEHARVETGHWASNTSTSSQQYGKVRKANAFIRERVYPRVSNQSLGGFP